MKKSDFYLKIMDAPHDSFLFEEGSAFISVSAWHTNERDRMVDEHIASHLFPNLERIGLEDLAEGEMEYNGKLSKKELGEQLERMGFIVEVV